MSDTLEQQDRRRFSRIPFDAQTELQIEDQVWPVKLIDISLKGLLVEAPEALTCPDNTPCQIRVLLSEDGACVEMQALVARQQGQLLGFQCEHIDLDSISHLRRLVELNLGDQNLLDRELEQLLPA